MSDALAGVAKEMRKLDRDLTQAIEQRDAAEECLSQMYYIVTGRSPEWSNKFGYPEALEDVGDAVTVLKKSIPRGENPP